MAEWAVSGHVVVTSAIYGADLAKRAPLLRPMPHRGPVVQVRAPQAFPRSQFCVFNFFVRRNWLAGEGDYFLRTKKLKMEFCGCSDTRRAFSRACIAKSAYHKPSLSRRMGAALPLRPCGSATRSRPSRQRPWGHRAGEAPPGAAGSGRKGPKAGGEGILLFFQNALIGEYKMPLAFCLFEVRLSEIRDQVRGPKARMRSILSSELASSGPRWRWTALRAD